MYYTFYRSTLGTQTSGARCCGVTAAVRAERARPHSVTQPAAYMYVAPLMMIHSTPLVGGGGTDREGGRSPAAAPPGYNHTLRRKPALRVCVWVFACACACGKAWKS